LQCSNKEINIQDNYELFNDNFYQKGTLKEDLINFSEVPVGNYILLFNIYYPDHFD